MACWAERFGPAPALLPLQTGVGLGSRQLDRPNLLRLVLASPVATGDPGEQLEPLLQQQAQIRAFRGRLAWDGDLDAQRLDAGMETAEHQP